MNLNYEQAVSDVLAGKYGNGTDRRTALTELGYDYPTIQTAVNTKLKGGDWLSTLPQATTASTTTTTTPWYSGTNVPNVSSALDFTGSSWDRPNGLGISYKPMNTGNQVSAPITHQSSPSGISPAPDTHTDNGAHARNPGLGAFAKKAVNLGKDVQSAFGNMDTFQKVDKVASSVKGLWDAYNGYKNNKMINRQLNFSMDMANNQYEANRKRVNSQLEDRQARRYAEQPHAHQSVADYMKKYGV